VSFEERRARLQNVLVAIEAYSRRGEVDESALREILRELDTIESYMAREPISDDFDDRFAYLMDLFTILHTSFRIVRILLGY